MIVEFEINEKYEFFPVIVPNEFLEEINPLNLTELKLILYLFSRINPAYKNVTTHYFTKELLEELNLPINGNYYSNILIAIDSLKEKKLHLRESEVFDEGKDTIKEFSILSSDTCYDKNAKSIEIALDDELYDVMCKVKKNFTSCHYGFIRKMTSKKNLLTYLYLTRYKNLGITSIRNKELAKMLDLKETSPSSISRTIDRVLSTINTNTNLNVSYTIKNTRRVRSSTEAKLTFSIHEKSMSETANIIYKYWEYDDADSIEENYHYEKENENE